MSRHIIHYQKALEREALFLQVFLHNRTKDFVDPLNEEEMGDPGFCIRMPHQGEAALVDFASLKGPWSLLSGRSKAA